MLLVTDRVDLEQVYAYQMRLAAPYFFPVDLESWKESFEKDVDGEGRTLFRELHGMAAYDEDTLVGFVQYGNTAFGFDEGGEISSDVSYPVIRSLYFDAGQEEAGRVLLEKALEELGADRKIYAFFHYFGMSCFARHGKLWERYVWIGELLKRYGFVVEHENVYYSALLNHPAGSEVALLVHDKTPGDQQTFDFLLENQQVGGCEIHEQRTQGIAYLRWIYVEPELQNRGIGSQCMAALKSWLYHQGMTRLDTDTALDNPRAQHYYEKNGFSREGITRSYFRMG